MFLLLLKNKYLIFIYFLFGFLAGYGQNQPDDSVLNLLNRTSEDTSRVNLLLKICSSMSDNNPGKALIYGNKALALSQQLEWQRGIAESKEYCGKVYLQTSDYNQALSCFQQALDLYQTLGENTGIASAMGNIGNIYCYEADYPKALDYYDQVLNMGKQTSNYYFISEALFYKGTVYSKLSAYPQALDLYQQSLLYAEQHGSLELKEVVLNNMGDVYCAIGNYSKSKDCYEQSYAINSTIKKKFNIMFNLEGLGEVYFALSDYRKSMEYYHQALQISQSLDDKITQADCIREIASCYNNLKLYDTALVKANQSLEMDHKIPYRLGFAQTLLLKGNIYYNTGNYLQSDASYLQSIDTAKVIAALDIQRDDWEGLSDLYEKMKEPDKEITAYKNYVTLKDTISNSEKTKLIILEEIKFDEIKKKMADEVLLKERHWKRNLQMIGIAIFIFSFVIIILMLSRIKAKPIVIKVLGMIGLLLVFEFISLLIEPLISKWTDDTPLYSLLLLVIIASVLIPTHHRLEHWVTEKLAHKHHPKKP
jgi:tetratricopeptide (TPR) repeat protein